MQNDAKMELKSIEKEGQNLEAFLHCFLKVCWTFSVVPDLESNRYLQCFRGVGPFSLYPKK